MNRIQIRDRSPTHDQVSQYIRNEWWEEINDSVSNASLYNEGHAYLERENEDVYVLDVDA